MHEVLVNRLGGLSLPKKSVVRLTDRPDMTLDVYRGRKTTNQQHNLSQQGQPLKKRITSSWSNFFHLELIPFWKGCIIKGSKQDFMIFSVLKG